VVEHGLEAPVELAPAARQLVRGGGEVIAAKHAGDAAELPERALQAGDERLVLEPQEDSTYVAKGELLPLMVIPAQKAKPRSSSTGAAVYIDGCAGAIRPMYRELSSPLRVELGDRLPAKS